VRGGRTLRLTHPNPAVFSTHPSFDHLALSHRESERLLSGIQRGPELGVEVSVLAVAGTVDRHLLAHLGLDAAALLHECFGETHLAGIAGGGGFPEGREQGSVPVKCSGS